MDNNNNNDGNNCPLLNSKHYYIDLINSSKAYQFTSMYHYSGVGFKKATLNQGIFRKTDNMLVGVLQWRCSAQSKIKLSRYVKEPIEELQIMAVKKDYDSIKYIKEPSETVQVEAVKVKYDALRYIKNPCFKAEITAVKNNEAAINFIYNLDAAKMKEFLKANVLVIKYIVRKIEKDDVIEVKENIVKDIIPEYVDNIECEGGKQYCLSLFLLSSDYAVFVVATKELMDILIEQ